MVGLSSQDSQIVAASTAAVDTDTGDESDDDSNSGDGDGDDDGDDRNNPDDNNSSGGKNARISLAIPKTGKYTVEATTNKPTDRGTYVLRLI